MRALSGKNLAIYVVGHHIGDPTGDCDCQRIVLGVQDEGDICHWCFHLVNPLNLCATVSDLQDVGLKLAPLLIWVVFAQVINLY